MPNLLYNRYQKQIKLDGFGIEAQEKLSNAKLLVIGAGGLGCASLPYLAAAGVGHLGIVDFDKVELSNLHRQVLYTHEDISQYKAELVAQKLVKQNIEITVKPYILKIDNSNALDIISGYDLVIDGSDNFYTRYIVNDACVILKKPLVYGSVMKYEGQVGVFNIAESGNIYTTNYRDLFPKPPFESEFYSCDDLGVLGVLPGVIGAMQATEAIKIITHIGMPLCNKILTYQALHNSFFEFVVNKNKALVEFPHSKEQFINYDYHEFCGEVAEVNEITLKELYHSIENNNTLIIDVREADELPIITDFAAIHIPLSQLSESENIFSSYQKIVLICNSGTRSKKGVSILHNRFPKLNIYSLKNGLNSLY